VHFLAVYRNIAVKFVTEFTKAVTFVKATICNKTAASCNSGHINTYWKIMKIISRFKTEVTE
jgi:hypothetical protein